MPWIDALRARENRLFASLSSHKVLLYATISSVAVSATIASALRRHSNFYSLAIHLSKSNRSVLILANFGLLVALLCAQCAQRLFFGSLRPQEIERLYDRLWFFVTESLLAFTIFRDDFDIPFLLMFGFLLFVKSFHWLASDRIEWMDQRPYPGPPILFHIRMTSLFTILWFIDLFMFAFAVDSTTKNGVGGMMMFANEYAILMASAMNVIAKYIICVVDLRRAQQRGGENAPPWQNKSMWIFYVELATDFLKLITYLLFFLFIVALYGLPLNIIRDVYLTGRSFVTRLRALIRYRAATRNMDERYPDATEQEMSAMTDRTCIICREEMYYQGRPGGVQPETQSPDGPNMSPKKLPCGHIFHFYCLRSWLERQQSCPTCRQSVLDTPPQNQQRQPQAARPQPQAGARQPPNLFGLPQAGVQQQPENDALARVLGRFARNVAQPPQAAAGQAQGPQNIGTQGWIPGQTPGVVIQYNIQYQGQPPHGQVQAPQSSQPVPPFTGFVGPNQDWRSWDFDQRWLNQRGTPAAQEPSTSGSGNQVPTLQAQSRNDASQTPAEAAAQAALRRFGGHSATSASFSSCSETVPITSSSSDTSTWKVPSLIPLNSNQAAESLRSPSQLARPGQLSSSPSALPAQVPSSSSFSTNSQTTSPQPYAWDRNHVTDAQLALLDQNTRGAIDERIRILQDVSNTITRCVEDLVRVRSVLPPSLSTASPQLPQDVTTSDVQSNEGSQPVTAAFPKPEASTSSYSGEFSQEQRSSFGGT